MCACVKANHSLPLSLFACSMCLSIHRIMLYLKTILKADIKQASSRHLGHRRTIKALKPLGRAQRLKWICPQIVYLPPDCRGYQPNGHALSGWAFSVASSLMPGTRNKRSSRQSPNTWVVPSYKASWLWVISPHGFTHSPWCPLWLGGLLVTCLYL